MNIQKTKYETFIVLIALLFSLNVFSQQLIESRQTSYYTYIYNITNDEALAIYQENLWEVDSSYFHTLIDSFPTDKEYAKRLPEGHYIKTFSSRNKQKVSITSIQNFEVFIFNNNTDLCIQVYDIKGRLIEDAEVLINNKKISFNKKSKTYLDRKSNKNGLLQVRYDGFTAYYNLSRSYDNSFIKRGTRKVLYGTSFKYVWQPVEFVARLPIDAVKSFRYKRILGNLYKTQQFFIRMFNRLACKFDDYYCEDNFDFKGKHTGYMVLNKPKYLPGDTVKVKAFIVTQKGKPIHKNVRAFITIKNKYVELCKISPYRKGAYEFQFYLHDSLGLKLDRNYSVHLGKDKYNLYYSARFRYEDYELKKNTLSIHVDQNNQYRNNDVTLSIAATDENDLRVMDGRIEVLVTPSSIFSYYDSVVYVPDTLLYLKKKIDVSGETQVVIPDSILPKANLHYAINTKLLTSDNEKLAANKGVTFYHERKELDVTLIADSLHVKYRKNGEVEPKYITVHSIDNFDNQTKVYEGEAPCTIQISPYFSTYSIEADSTSRIIDMSRESSLVQCFSERTNDSIRIEVHNPRGIPFSYDIYKKNKQKQYGFTDSLKINENIQSKQNYFVSLRYLWGGEVKEDTYRIPLIDKKLHVEVIEPSLVYPGQKSTIKIKVTDVNGEPVKGADLTAYGLTKKFNYKAPNLPYVGKERGTKNIINNFDFKNFEFKNQIGLPLDYDEWKTVARIDSIEYYKFLYPEHALYAFEYDPTDSITQFAPFIVEDGAVEPVHVVYVDGRPIYFSWSTNIRPYSFPIDSGYHQIKIRTTYNEITIDSMHFNQGKKLIFSLDQKLAYPHVTIKKKQATLSYAEKRVLYNYIAPFRYDKSNVYGYLKDQENIQMLVPENEYQSYNFAGPIAGNLNFYVPESYSTQFFHEPFFEYDFAQGLLKMWSKTQRSYPSILTKNIRQNRNLEDQVFTESFIYNQWRNFIEKSRYRTKVFVNPNKTNVGEGRLDFLLKSVKDQQQNPVNILLLKNDDHEFIRVYPGTAHFMHALKKGSYKLIFIYPDAQYYIEDSIHIEANGLNYYEFQQGELNKRDSFSLGVIDIIEAKYIKYSLFDQGDDKKIIYQQYHKGFKYEGEGKEIEGYVFDFDDEPLIGASVIVKGTTYGTITDINGYYKMMIPLDKKSLIISYTGFEMEQIEIGSNSIVNAKLEEGSFLDEVVVVASGLRKNKTNLGYTVSRITSSNLRNAESIGHALYVDGQRINALQAKAAGVLIKPGSVNGKGDAMTIRGNESLIFEKSPLYIIDGNVFIGDISEFDETLIKSIHVLKDEQATALYGKNGADGVVLIETIHGTYKTHKFNIKSALYSDGFQEEIHQAHTIRNNFSDDAFWEPKLTTDKNGEVEFDVVFPDDVTSWETFYLAMNSKQQTGQTSGEIKSYKPLMAQLSLSRFLVEGDTTYSIGKVLNYSPKVEKVSRSFEIDGKELFNSTQICEDIVIDTLEVAATQDSLNLAYYIETGDGYLDGERRSIPVFPRGIEMTNGDFYVLDKDTSIHVPVSEHDGHVFLYARADLMEVVSDELHHVINYKYLCNEQLASKLKAYLTQKVIADYTGKDFKNDRHIKKIIKMLSKNQKSNGLWGWWGSSSNNYWISLHVIEALLEAKRKGYSVSLDQDNIIENLVWQLEHSKDQYNKMRILKIIHLLGSTINVDKYLEEIELVDDKSLNWQLHLIELKQDFGLEYSLDSLVPFRDSTLFGNVYYTNKKQDSHLLNNDIHNTLMVYNLLKRDYNKEEELSLIRNYFLENRKNGYWRNTFESMKIIEAILPDLLNDKEKLKTPTLIFEGGIDTTINVFPFEMTVDAQEDIMVNKSGDFPIYFTAYQKYWDKSPAKHAGDFEISTRFNGDSLVVLEAGEKTTLTAHVKVLKDAEFVMINVPIPAGCSYATKKKNSKETHREYFKHETAIFIQDMKEGEYTFEIELTPRYAGTYSVNPAKIELMYYPTFYANTELKKVKIE